MPLSKYYGGHGKKVMRSMKRRYGAKKGKSVFYAAAKNRAHAAFAAKRRKDKGVPLRSLLGRHHSPRY